MDTCSSKPETIPPHVENTIYIETTNLLSSEPRDNMQEEQLENPITSTVTGNNSYLNSNTLYDALPIDDTVIGELNVISDKLNNATNLQDDTKNISCSSGSETQQLKHNTVVQNDTSSSNKQKISQLVDYGMSDSEDSESDSDESLSDTDSSSANNKQPPSTTKPDITDENVIGNAEFREIVSSSDSTSEYDSDSSTSCSEIGACGVTVTPTSTEKKRSPDKMKLPRTKGELTLDQLPPIEELKISVPEDECIEIGVVTSIIDQLVIVQSLRDTPACDIDTLFFLNRGTKPLGRVFDVLGPVSEPLYAIRFNSYEQAMETGVKPGTPVYCAPNTSHTSYVFVSELMKMKGSDASWEHNNEPPEACLDYSDDEEERNARRVHRNRRQSGTTEAASKSNSLERNRKFEKQMNDKNLLMNERYKNQQNFTARNNKKKPDIRPPMMGAAVAPPPQHTWVLPNPAATMPRPQFWSAAPPYQFAAYPPYGALAMFPQMDVTGVAGPRQHFVPAMMAAAPPPNAVFAPPPFNPSIPPPIMRPQPVTYFPPKPRHPPWVPPQMNIGVNVLQPPRGNFGGNGSSYTQ